VQRKWLDRNRAFSSKATDDQNKITQT